MTSPTIPATLIRVISSTNRVLYSCYAPKAADVTAGGENVYPGCAKDYTGWDVNKATVLAVLMGNNKAVRNIGSGRVLKKNPFQKVFLFYSDHGSPGSISMPYGPPIYADELNHALNYLAQNKHFAQMLIYLESCEAGSMFRGFKMDSNVVALTAANAIESSVRHILSG